MKTRHFFYSFLFIVAACLLCDCSSTKTMKLNSIQLTSQLRPGMTYAEVESILGKPRSSQVVDNKWIARYNLQEMWKGYIPYDMVFNASDQTLISWAENKQAWEENQAQLKMVADEVSKQTESNTATAGQGAGNNAPAFENSPDLMKYFAGSYYSFSSVGGGQTGGSERKISLCPAGRYISSFESGYSGGAGTWGTANQGGGGGTWRITGSKTSGTIVTTDGNGRSTTYKYEVCGDGCIYFGNSKFAYAGAPECR
jgi:hypothetical protein